MNQYNFENIEGNVFISQDNSVENTTDQIINKFNFSLCFENSAHLIIGSNSSGKTTLIIEMIHEFYNNKIVDEFVVMTSEANLSKYDEFDDNMYCGYDSSIIQNVYEKQIEKSRNNEQCSNIMLIFDDCLE